MKKLRAYATAAHFGPTMIVTSIAFILALVLVAMSVNADHCDSSLKNSFI